MKNSEWEKALTDSQWIEALYGDSSCSRTEVIEVGLDCVRTGVYSDIGQRSSQQDAAIVSESYEYIENRRVIAIMCDGMGGLAGGDLASGYCVNKLYEMFCNVNAEKDIPRFYSMMIDALDRHVKQMEAADGTPLGAGTTQRSTQCIS